MSSMQAAVKTILASGEYTEQDIALYAKVSRETIRRIRTGKTKKTRPQTSANIMALYFSLQQKNEFNKKP